MEQYRVDRDFTLCGLEIELGDVIEIEDEMMRITPSGEKISTKKLHGVTKDLILEKIKLNSVRVYE